MAYEQYHHTVHSFKIGLPISHDSTNTHTPCWKFFAINARTTPWDEVEKITANYAAMANRLAAEWETCAMVLPSFCAMLPRCSDSGIPVLSTITCNIVCTTDRNQKATTRKRTHTHRNFRLLNLACCTLRLGPALGSSLPLGVAPSLLSLDGPRREGEGMGAVQDPIPGPVIQRVQGSG